MLLRHISGRSVINHRGNHIFAVLVSLIFQNRDKKTAAGGILSVC